MMWFGCVGASSKNASVWLCKHSDEACSLASGFGVSFVWVFATAKYLPKQRKQKHFPWTVTCSRHPHSTLSRDAVVLTGDS